MTRVHYSCPTCTCDRPARLVINVDAPFFPLVCEADRLIYADYISRRTATRQAHRETSS
jgi:hypothetical protein